MVRPNVGSGVGFHSRNVILVSFVHYKVVNLIADYLFLVILRGFPCIQSSCRQVIECVFDYKFLFSRTDLWVQIHEIFSKMAGVEESNDSAPVEMYCKGCNHKNKRGDGGIFVKCIICEYAYHKTCFNKIAKSPVICHVLFDGNFLCDKHIRKTQDNIEPNTNAMNYEINILKSENLTLKLELEKLKEEFKKNDNVKTAVETIKCELLDYFTELKKDCNRCIETKTIQPSTQTTNTTITKTGGTSKSFKDEDINLKTKASNNLLSRTQKTPVIINPSRPVIVENKENIIDNNKENIIDNNATPKTIELSTAQSKGHRKHFVKGTNNSTLLKSAVRNAWFFVTNLEKHTTETQIKDMLSPICDVTCEKLNLIHSDRQSSFKISAPFDFKEEIMNGSVWPHGTRLSRYYFPKKKTEIPADKTPKNFLEETTTQTRNLQ